MKIKPSIMILITAFIVIPGTGYKGLLAAELQKLPAIEIENVRITIIYDNNPGKGCLDVKWGFSCLIEGLDQTILFDAGQEPSVLLSNMAKLGIDPRLVKSVVLSHEHSDHIGGLKGFLGVNPEVNVYLLKSFSSSLKKEIINYGANLVEVNNAPLPISKYALSTGELRSSPVNEQSLLISTNKGLIIITGCSHPGIENIVERAKKITKQQVFLILGGFHLFLSRNEPKIRDTIFCLKKFGVRYVAPCHCSGSKARQLFAEEYGEKFIACGVGRTISSKDLTK